MLAQTRRAIREGEQHVQRCLIRVTRSETQISGSDIWAPLLSETLPPCLPDDSPPGSACDGEADARVLVRQPTRPPHGAEGQENRVSGVDGH